MQSLPEEIILQILYHLDYSDTINTCTICLRTRKLFTWDILWKEKISQIRPQGNLGDKNLYHLIKIYRLISGSGQIYSYGDNTYGQAGCSVTRVVTQPTPIGGFNKVIQVACGSYHTALVTAEGYLYTLGNNDWGKLGFNELGAMYPRPL